MARRMLFLAVVALAGCDARNTVTVVNASGRAVDVLDLGVAEQSFHLGPLADGEMRSVSFTPTTDASLSVCVGSSRGEACGDYGYVTHGLVQAHLVTLRPETVRYAAF